MKPYKQWLKDKKEELLEKYEFDIHELLREAGNDSDYLEQINSFKEWSKIVYQSELEDEEEDKENKEENDDACIKCGKSGSFPDSICEYCYNERTSQ